MSAGACLDVYVFGLVIVVALVALTAFAQRAVSRLKRIEQTLRGQQPPPETIEEVLRFCPPAVPGRYRWTLDPGDVREVEVVRDERRGWLIVPEIGTIPVHALRGEWEGPLPVFKRRENPT